MMVSSQLPDDLEDILARCLQAIEEGRATPQQCLAAFPAHARALEPLLRSAQAIREAPHPVLSHERVAALEQLVVGRAAKLAAARRAQMSTASRGKRGENGLLRWAAALGIVAILVLVSGAGTVAAAGNALPGQALYGVKRTVEDLQLSLASEADRPEFLAHLAEERVAELEALTQTGEVPAEVIEGVIQSSQVALDALQNTSGEQQDELAEKLVDVTARQQAVLTEVMQKAPPQAQAGLQRALEASQHGHERATQAMSGEQEVGPPEHAGPPDGEGPPGLEGKEPGPPEEPPGQAGKQDGDDEQVDSESTSTPEPGHQGGGPKCDSPPCGQGQGQGQGRGSGRGNNSQANGESP